MVTLSVHRHAVSQQELFAIPFLAQEVILQEFSGSWLFIKIQKSNLAVYRDSLGGFVQRQLPFTDVSGRTVHLKEWAVTSTKLVFQANVLLTSFIIKANKSFTSYQNYIEFFFPFMSFLGQRAKKPNPQKAVFPPDRNVYISNGLHKNKVHQSRN